jgi:hypothetical protein
VVNGGSRGTSFDCAPQGINRKKEYNSFGELCAPVRKEIEVRIPMAIAAQHRLRADAREVLHLLLILPSRSVARTGSSGACAISS